MEKAALTRSNGQLKPNIAIHQPIYRHQCAVFIHSGTSAMFPWLQPIRSYCEQTAVKILRQNPPSCKWLTGVLNIIRLPADISFFTADKSTSVSEILPPVYSLVGTLLNKNWPTKSFCVQQKNWTFFDGQEKLSSNVSRNLSANRSVMLSDCLKHCMTIWTSQHGQTRVSK